MDIFPFNSFLPLHWRFVDHLNCWSEVFGVPFQDIFEDYEALKVLKEIKIASQVENAWLSQLEASNGTQKRPSYESFEVVKVDMKNKMQKIIDGLEESSTMRHIAIVNNQEGFNVFKFSRKTYSQRELLILEEIHE